jgi:hypothetical protein
MSENTLILGGEGARNGPGKVEQRAEGDREDMAGRACCGPDFVKLEKARIEPGADRGQMTYGRNASDRKPGRRADGISIGLAQADRPARLPWTRRRDFRLPL